MLASANHVTGFEPTTRRLAGHEPPRPDSLYGATKAFGEALGRLYADRFGLEVVCLRIGTFAERPLEPRHLSSWLSPADGLRLVAACLSAPSPLGFRVVYGASANTRGWWDFEPARELGYAPQDDAEAFAGELAPAGEEPRLGPQGGEFAEPSHGGWPSGRGGEGERPTKGRRATSMRAALRHAGRAAADLVRARRRRGRRRAPERAQARARPAA